MSEQGTTPAGEPPVDRQGETAALADGMPADAIKLTDARSMRVLAHPVRLNLLGELRVRGPQSVGMLSELLDEAPGSISYHVGRLAEFGFVVEAPELARDKRERWWRSAHAKTTWLPFDSLEDPERRAASTVLRRAVLDRYVERLQAYLEAEATLEPAWVKAAVGGDAVLHLSAPELTELSAELVELSERWRHRAGVERADTRPVSLIYQAFPWP
jgi:predicted transcriptional regulator